MRLSAMLIVFERIEPMGVARQPHVGLALAGTDADIGFEPRQPLAMVADDLLGLEQQAASLDGMHETFTRAVFRREQMLVDGGGRRELAGGPIGRRRRSTRL
jgi:hypothetical protein